VEHIATEGEVCEKHTSVAPTRPRALSRPQPARVNEATKGRKNGFLKDYLVGSARAATLAVPEEDQAHEMPIHGEVHTISGGFSGGEPTASQRKRYVR